MRDIPSKWASTILEKVLAEGLSNGRSVPTAETGFPVLRLTALDNGRIDLGERKTGQWSREEAERYLVRSGDFLISRGNGSIRLVGRGGLVPHDDEVAFPDTMIRARPAGIAMDPQFLRYQWETRAVRQQIEKAARTTAGIYKVSQGDLLNIALVLAPLPEQRRIVAEIEKHFTRLDAAVATLERVQTELERARASVLKAAVEGRLVPTEAELARAEGRTYEPASVLLERILVERKRKHEEAQGKKKYKPPVELEPEERPALPEGWTWASVDAVGDVLLGRQRAPQYLTGRWTKPYLRVANVQDDKLELEDIEEMDFSPEHFETYRLIPGDILVSEGQSPHRVGQSAIYRGGIESLCFQKTLHRFRPIPGGPSSEYAQIVFRAHVKTGVFKKLASITTNIAHLTLIKFRSSRFPLPPHPEQARIIAEAGRRLSVLDALEQAVHRNLTRCTALRQSILKRAFSGKLVPQDPTDEPASALLDPIRATTS